MWVTKVFVTAENIKLMHQQETSKYKGGTLFETLNRYYTLYLEDTENKGG